MFEGIGVPALERATVEHVHALHTAQLIHEPCYSAVVEQIVLAGLVRPRQTGCPFAAEQVDCILVRWSCTDVLGLDIEAGKPEQPVHDRATQ